MEPNNEMNDDESEEFSIKYGFPENDIFVLFEIKKF